MVRFSNGGADSNNENENNTSNNDSNHAIKNENSSDVFARECKYGDLKPVAFFNGPMPTGVTVSHRGRIFVNFPKWGDDVLFTVAEIKNDGSAIPYPDGQLNSTNERDLSEAFVSVQSVVIDPQDRLWILDTGSPLFKPTQYGGPKLVCIDINTDKILKKILFPQSVALPSTYLNDVRFNLAQGSKGFAFITDSSQKGPNGIIVVDLDSGESWRRLDNHPSTKPLEIKNFLPIIEGRPFILQKNDAVIQAADMGSDGIAISSNGERIFYCPLGSRRLYSVATSELISKNISESAVAETVIDEGDKGGASDGLESDAEGRIYATNYEHNSIMRRSTDGIWETLVHDPRLLWPDTLSLAKDGYLYVTANQLHRQARFHDGKDKRVRPYGLFKIKANAQPVLLKN